VQSFKVVYDSRKEINMEKPLAWFTEFSKWIAEAAGHPISFSFALLTIIVWAATGPLFDYSDTWQLVINTGTTIITFLMVFLIQNTQNRDGAAIQTKLDELIRASAAQNTYIGIEHLTEEELDELRKRCEARAKKLQGVKKAADAAEGAANRKAAQAADEATTGLLPFKPRK
jgi:low affinity Fe/Cu permease